MRKHWRCFHCDEVFTSPREARIHFGGGPYEDPGCVLKDSETGLLGIIRDQAEQLARYRAEDTDLIRVIREMQTECAAEKRDAEQRGYDQGLRDGRATPPARFDNCARPGNCTLWPGCGCTTQSGPHACEGKPL